MGAYATGKQTLRIDTLPENIREKILALAARAHRGTTVTSRQVEYVLDALESGMGTQGWKKTNASVALGRVALSFFNENPAIKAQFKSHISKMKAEGRVVERASKETPESATA